MTTTKPAYFTYSARVKTRDQIDAELPRNLRGWWYDVSPGRVLENLRDATAADLARCTLHDEASKDPADYLCENFPNGSLITRHAIQWLRMEVPLGYRNLFKSDALVGDPNHDIVPTLRMFDGLMMTLAADEIELLRAMRRTPNASLPPLGEGPRRKMVVMVDVPEDWEKRLDMQWVLEREIHADRWNWSWPVPVGEPFTKDDAQIFADALMADGWEPPQVPPVGEDSSINLYHRLCTFLDVHAGIPEPKFEPSDGQIYAAVSAKTMTPETAAAVEEMTGKVVEALQAESLQSIAGWKNDREQMREIICNMSMRLDDISLCMTNALVEGLNIETLDVTDPSPQDHGRLVDVIKRRILPIMELASPSPVTSQTAQASMEALLWKFVGIAGAFPLERPNVKIWPHVAVYIPEMFEAINKACNLLHDAAFSEDGVDGDDAMTGVAMLRGAAKMINKTTTECYLDQIVSKVAEVAGIPQDDEFDVLKMISQIAYPKDLNDELKEILGIMNFVTGPWATMYRTAGETDIPNRCEDEQAYILDKLIRLYLEHGKNWNVAANMDLERVIKIVQDKRKA